MRFNEEISNIVKGRMCYNLVEKFLLENGFNIFLPITEDGKIDCIAVKDNLIYRMQIKKLQKTEYNLTLPVRKLNHNKTSHKSYLYSEYEIDFLVGVDLENEDVYFVPSEFSKDYTSTISINKIQDFKNVLNGAL